MKRNGFVYLILWVMLLCAGCSFGTHDTKQDKKQFTMKTIEELREEAKNLEDNYVNLNLSDTVISIPDVDEISDLVFPITYTLEEQKAKFEDNIRKYVGISADVDLTPYMNMMYWDLEANDRLTIPYNEATEEQLEQIQYLSYNDGKNSQIIVFSNYMMEMGNYELPTLLTNETKDYSKVAAGYRGWDLGNVVETYYPLKDDISDVSYTLADGEVRLKDAIAYAEKHVKEDYYFVGSEFLEYYVCEAQVRQLKDSLYYYQFHLRPEYKHVPFNNERGYKTVDREDELLAQVFGDDHKVSMFCGDRLGFIWSSCHSYEKVESRESHTEFISLEDACTLLSEQISQKKEFKVSSIELLYQTECQYENEEKMYWGYVNAIYCHPVYQFYVGNPKTPGLTSCYFNVDAITGEIIYVEG